MPRPTGLWEGDYPLGDYVAQGYISRSMAQWVDRGSIWDRQWREMLANEAALTAMEKNGRNSGRYKYVPENYYRKVIRGEYGKYAFNKDNPALLGRCDLKGSKFIESVFDGGTLTCSDLTEVSFLTCSMIGVNIQFADTVLTSFAESTIGWGKTIFDHTFELCNFDRIKAVENGMCDCIFRGCSFEKADLTDYSMRGSEFRGKHDRKSFRRGKGSIPVKNGGDIFGCRANMNECNFENTKMRYVKFEEVSLNRTKFIGSELSSCSFKNCNLINAIFKDVDLKGVRFENCDLTGVRFINCSPDEKWITSCKFGLMDLKVLSQDRKIEQIQYMVDNGFAGKFGYLREIDEMLEENSEDIEYLLDLRKLFDGTKSKY